MKKYLLLLLIPLLFLITPVKAEINIPDRPDNGIYDSKGYLSQSTVDKVKAFNYKSEFQFDIYIPDTINNESIDDIALMTAKHWLIGSKSETGNGFVLVISVEDKKIKLEPSISTSYYFNNSQVADIVNKAILSTGPEDYDGLVDSILFYLNYANIEKDIKKEREGSMLFGEELFNQYRGTVSTFRALMLGAFLFPVGLFITLFLFIWYLVKRQNRQDKENNFDSAITETKSQVFSNYEESKESSHFDSPFE